MPIFMIFAPSLLTERKLAFGALVIVSEAKQYDAAIRAYLKRYAWPRYGKKNVQSWGRNATLKEFKRLYIEYLEEKRDSPDLQLLWPRWLKKRIKRPADGVNATLMPWDLMEDFRRADTSEIKDFASVKKEDNVYPFALPGRMRPVSYHWDPYERVREKINIKFVFEDVVPFIETETTAMRYVGFGELMVNRWEWLGARGYMKCNNMTRLSYRNPWTYSYEKRIFYRYVLNWANETWIEQNIGKYLWQVDHEYGTCAGIIPAAEGPGSGAQPQRFRATWTTILSDTDDMIAQRSLNKEFYHAPCMDYLYEPRVSIADFEFESTKPIYTYPREPYPGEEEPYLVVDGGVTRRDEQPDPQTSSLLSDSWLPVAFSDSDDLDSPGIPEWDPTVPSFNMCMMASSTTVPNLGYASSALPFAAATISGS